MAIKRKRKVNKETKTWKLKEIRKLRNKALKLWAVAVKVRAGFVCEYPGCGATEMLNNHHIESRSNRALRLALENGVCACVIHHKWGKEAFHRSFVAAYKCLTQKRQSDLDCLIKHYLDDLVETKEYLEAKIQEFTIIINEDMKNDSILPG